MTKKKTLKVVFEPGCFDDFDGTQEELNEVMQAIKDMVASGELEKNSRPLDEQEIIDLENRLADKTQRKLQ